MNMQRKYWASMVIFIGIFAPCTVLWWWRERHEAVREVDSFKLISVDRQSFHQIPINQSASKCYSLIGQSVC